MKGDDLRAPGWDDPPEPSRKRGGAGRLFRALSIGNLMLVLIYFAGLSWAIRGAMASNSDSGFYAILLAVMIGLGVAAFGLWLASRLTWLGFIGWFLFVAGYMTVAFATTHAFSIPSLPVLIGAILYLDARKRATNQEALLWVLNLAADRGMPLSPAIQAFAAQSGGIFGVRTATLAEFLRRGASLADALESVPQSVPGNAPLLIRMGQDSGNLAAGLREAALAQSRRTLAWRGVGIRIAYLSWIAATGFGIVTFVLYFIVPKLEAIFKDFGMMLPEVTILVIRSSHLAVDYFWIPGLVLLGFLVSYLGSVFWGTGVSFPLIDRIFSRRHSILIFRSLAVVVESGRPVAPALQALAQWYPTYWVRQKLGSAAAYAGQGVDWAEALHASGLVSRADVGVIGSASRAGNLAWALRQLAETGERRGADGLQIASQLLFLMAILALGAMVFVIAVAFFLPLTTLILRLAS